MNLKERREKCMEGFGKGIEKCSNKIISKVKKNKELLYYLFLFS